MDRQQEFVLRTIEERDIRFVRLWFTDVLGSLKSVAVAPAELEGAFAEGIGFDGSAIEGFARVYEADMLAKPDPSTFQVLPWRGEQPGHGADVLRHPHCPTARPAVADPRYVLKRALAKAADMGFTFYTHPEIEFFLLKQRPEPGRARPMPVDQAGYFDHVPHGTGHDFRRAADHACSSRWASRWSSATTRAARARRRSTCATPTRCTHRRQHHDLPHGHQGGRARAGHLRLLHAQAVHRPPRLGHAHPPVAVRGRPQRLLRGRRAVPALQDRPAVHRRACSRTPPRSPRSPTSG